MRRRFQLRLRSLLIAVVVSAVVAAYVGSYYRLSRRGMQESGLYGVPGILYVPIEDASASQGVSWQNALAAFFSPANWIDRHCFGGRPAAQCVMWRLSG